MNDWTETEVSISEIKNLLDNDIEVQVLSPDGFVSVNLFVEKGYWDEYVLITEDDKTISVNENHLFETDSGWVYAKDLIELGRVAFISESGLSYGKVTKTGNRIPIVDINVDHPNHRYYTNGISSHNTGVGKSTFLGHLACAYFMQGYNVFYATFEMSREKISERLDANLLHIPINELRNIPKGSFEKGLKSVLTKTAGKLIVEEYPTSTASVLHVAHTLNELELKKNFKPDVIILDYLNIMLSARIKSSPNNMYTYVKYIAEEVRGLAVQKNVPVWTATQLNREGFKSSDVGLENTSESFGIPATADLMLALVSTEELEKQNQIMVKQLKNRYNEAFKDRRFLLGIDRSRMKFFDVEQSAQSGIIQNVRDVIASEKENAMPVRGADQKYSGFKF